jgi:hypothetical protein
MNPTKTPVSGGVHLVKALRAGIAALEDTTEGDMDEPLRLTKRLPADTAPIKRA